jgi:hypothetical protein
MTFVAFLRTARRSKTTTNGVSILKYLRALSPMNWYIGTRTLTIDNMIGFCHER